MINASPLLFAIGLTDIFRGSDPSGRFGPSSFRGLIAAAGATLAITWATDVSVVWAASGIVVAAGWVYLSGRTTVRYRQLGLALLAVASAFALLSPTPADLGRFQLWYESLQFPFVAVVAPAKILFGVAIALVLTSTTNIAVKVVIVSAESARRSSERDEGTLKGGRFIGPMERFLIVGLSISGQFAAVGGLLAAKGIVRFPEISKSNDTGQQAEYFLVGTLASWLVALGFAAMLAL